MSAGRRELPARAGWIAANPPYGERLATVEPALRDLADLLRRGTGWQSAVLAPTAVARRLASLAARAVADDPIRTSNGGLHVDLALLVPGVLRS